MANGTDIVDSASLIANDIVVLVAQLNEAINKAAQKGLRVEIDCSNIVDVKGLATYYPVVSAKILAEIH